MTNCPDVLTADNGPHPCACGLPHRVHHCDCDLGLRWMRRTDGGADLVGHMTRVPPMRTTHTIPGNGR
jgi:hypothetical protein